MVSELNGESDMSGQSESKVDDIQKVEQLISVARERSRRIRDITVTLLLGLIAFGALLVFNVYQQHQKAKEQQAAAQRNKDLAEKALKEQAKLLERVDNSRRASVFLASGVNKARYQKTWKEALADYDKAPALDPDNPEALGLAGYLTFRTGNTQSAARMLRRAVEVDPTNPWNHYNLALALWANGNKEDAVGEVELVLKIDP